MCVGCVCGSYVCVVGVYVVCACGVCGVCGVYMCMVCGVVCVGLTFVRGV